MNIYHISRIVESIVVEVGVREETEGGRGDLRRWARLGAERRGPFSKERVSGTGGAVDQERAWRTWGRGSCEGP